MRLFRRLAGDIRAATAVEYGLMLALVFLALAVGVSVLGHQVQNSWQSVNNKMPTVS